jgi:hypothetical protein
LFITNTRISFYRKNPIFQQQQQQQKMSEFKLSYFDFRGRGEIARFLFVYGGIPFQDHRIKFEEWPPLKAKSPFGMVTLIIISFNVYIQNIIN